MNEVDKLLEDIKLLQHDIMLIQLNCSHINRGMKPGSSTGYGGDNYWVDHTCHTCSAKWREYV